MTKRRITVTVDQALIAQAQDLGVENLSAAVNQALHAHLERLGRDAALGRLLEHWEAELGPVSGSDLAEAALAFDELDDVGDQEGAA